MFRALFVASVLVLVGESRAAIDVSGEVKFEFKIHGLGLRSELRHRPPVSWLRHRAPDLKQVPGTSTEEELLATGYQQKTDQLEPRDFINRDEFGRKIALKKNWLENVVDNNIFNMVSEEAGLSIEVPTPSEPRVPRWNAARTPRCVYRAPQTWQADAMLSDMLNHLTRVFVRLQRSTHVPRDRSDQPPPPAPSAPREPRMRFRVQTAKRNGFFDQIFANMSAEFMRNFNWTRAQAQYAGLDPCAHQPEMKKLWKQILDNAQAAYYSAALHCVEEFLRSRGGGSGGGSGRGGGGGGGGRRARSLGRRLLRDLDDIRAAHLHTLCQKFQLCFTELMSP